MVCCPSTGFAFVPRLPVQVVHTPANTANGLVSSKANHVGVFFGFVSAYSQNEVHGTTQRFAGFSHPRQCGLLVFRMFVTGAPPNCGGPGMPHRAIVSSRLPSGALRTIGAM
jgi:hypothetical protein